ncbi:hypothetical protein EVAR_87839_1 [Eumeta japonica]|uniref:Uncharacterized protein n=1 Tax=Eumeta variegata TaxID=151549 RepID=A0A4C1YG57_EUMVA|nr:hypothetical protein EVAR_87839_1 [Eumeta japonica]
MVNQCAPRRSPRHPVSNRRTRARPLLHSVMHRDEDVRLGPVVARTLRILNLCPSTWQASDLLSEAKRLTYSSGWLRALAVERYIGGRATSALAHVRPVNPAGALGPAELRTQSAEVPADDDWDGTAPEHVFASYGSDDASVE